MQDEQVKESLEVRKQLLDSMPSDPGQENICLGCE